MPKLVILRGLPAAGKSFFALKLVQQGYKRVCTDDLRLVMDNGVYSKANEIFAQDVQQTIITLALQNNLNVVSDNCNLNPYHIKMASAICRDVRAELEIIHLDTPLHVCIERDLQRTKGRVGKDVIVKMYNKYYIDGQLAD